MAQVEVRDANGKTVETAELADSVFGVEPHVFAMHQVVRSQMAARRSGTHATKTRGKVRGGGRKPWRQKGTGRARQGSTRAAQWVGGGRIHTPHPRKYTQSMPQKMRRAALRSALSVKAAEASVVVVDNLEAVEPKTRLMARALTSLVGDSSVLILIPEKGTFESVIRSSNNLPDAKVLLANYLNIRDLLQFDKLILPLSSVDKIAEQLG